MSHARACSVGRAWDGVVAADADRTAGVRSLTRTARQVEIDLAAAVGVGVPTEVAVERLTESSAIISPTYGIGV